MRYSLHQKSRFYSQLHIGLHAGLPLELILHRDNLPDSEKIPGPDLSDAIRSGRTLYQVLGKTGLFSAWEMRLLAVGENTGALDTVAKNLADFFTERYAQFRELRSKLVYPFILLIAAIVIPPLPALARGDLGANAYLIKTALSIFAMYAAYAVLIKTPFQKFSSGGFNPLVLSLLPLVGRKHLFRRIYEAAYLDLLTLCMQCGMDALQTLKLMEFILPRHAIRNRHRQAIRLVEQHGQSLVQVLFDNHILSLPRHRAFMQTAQESGTLHSELRKYALANRQEVNLDVRHHIRQFSWMIYLFALLLAASGFIGSSIVTVA